MTSSVPSATSDRSVWAPRSRPCDLSRPVQVQPVAGLLQQFDAHARAFPANVFAASADLSLTYEAAQDAVRSLAGRIIEKLPPERRLVAIYAARTPSLAIAILAAVRAGATFSLIDPKYPAERVLACQLFASPGLVLAATGEGEVASGAGRLAEALGVELMCVDNECDDPVHTQQTDKTSASLSGSCRAMYLAFTSGTTGLPKAVWGDEAAVVNCFAWQSREFGIEAKDRVSVLSGLSHDPLLRDVLMPAWTGASSHFPPNDVYTVPGALAAWLRDTKITVVHLTASLCHLLLRVPVTHGRTLLPDLRVALFGGEALPVSLAERLAWVAPHATVVNCYGATETPQIMAFHRWSGVGQEPGTAESSAAFVPIGKGIDGVQLLVFDPNNQLCAVEETGQIFVRTPHRALCVEDLNHVPSDCYIANPDSKDPTDLLYRSGDYGQLRSDGSVVFVGRRDRQIKVRGQRVDLSEVERVVACLVGVEQFAVDSESGDLGSEIVTYATVSDGSLDAEQIRHSLGLQLPEFMVPRRIVIVRQMPTTPNGKVDLLQLRNLKATDSAAPLPRVHMAPAGHEGSTVHERLDDLELPIDRSGGLELADSLSIVEVCCALENEFGVAFPASEVRCCHTRSDLVRLIELKLELRREFEGLQRSSSVDEAGSRAETRIRDRPWLARWLPQREGAWAAVSNRILQLIARVAPDAMRVRLHRRRGVRIGAGVSIGYDCVVETAFPQLVAIGDGVNVGMRCTIIAHFRGMENVTTLGPTVVIDQGAFVGPGVIVLPNVRIGAGAVIAAGSVVSSDIPAMTYARGNPARVLARCGLPLTGSVSYADFLANLVPLDRLSRRRGGSDE
jgi:amino acid adenylation domain-containing protein